MPGSAHQDHRAASWDNAYESEVCVLWGSTQISGGVRTAGYKNQAFYLPSSTSKQPDIPAVEGRPEQAL